MTAVLAAANHELFRRPAEQQFSSFEELRTAAAEQRRRSRDIECRERDVLFGESGDIFLGENAVVPTHFSMSQLAAMAKVPMALLERLKPETRASVLNQTFPRGRKHKAGLAEGDELRCLTSDRFERVWDEALLESLDTWLIGSGFEPTVPGGDRSGGAKPLLFRSDRDMHLFLTSTEEARDSFGGLKQGIIIHNGEVGARSFGFMTCIYRSYCSNGLVLGLHGAVQRSQRHTSSVRNLFRDFESELRTISNKVSPLVYSAIEKAAKTPFTEDGKPETAAKRLNKEFGISRDLVPEVLAALTLPENPGSDGDTSVWAYMNAVSSVAKLAPYAEDRVGLAATAGELLSIR